MTSQGWERDNMNTRRAMGFVLNSYHLSHTHIYIVYMYACVHIYIYTYTLCHTHIYMYTFNLYIHTHCATHTHTRIYVCIYIYMHAPECLQGRPARICDAGGWGAQHAQTRICWYVLLVINGDEWWLMHLLKVNCYFPNEKSTTWGIYKEYVLFFGPPVSKSK